MAEFLAADLHSKLLHVGPFGNGWSSDGKVTPTALAAPDTLKPLRIPGGIRVDQLMVNCDDLDSGGSPLVTLDVGYTPVDGSSPTENTTYFVTAMTEAKAGGILNCRFDPITFQKSVDILINVNAAADTFQAGDIVVIAKGQNVGVK